MPGVNKDEKLEALLDEMLEKKERMESDMDTNMTVQLHKRAYEIDFDAY